MAMIKIDRRKEVVIEKRAITDFKNAVKEDCRGNLTKERVLGMIEYYLE